MITFIPVQATVLNVLPMTGIIDMGIIILIAEIFLLISLLITLSSMWVFLVDNILTFLFWW